MGAVYVMERNFLTGAWTHKDFIKASNCNDFDNFGIAVALSADGNTLAASAHRERSLAAGVNGNQTDRRGQNVGAVYIFRRLHRSGNWTQEAYIKVRSHACACVCSLLKSQSRRPILGIMIFLAF